MTTEAHLWWLLEQAANHVWQSTLVTAVIWLLVLACRHNGASVRSRLWLVASVKWLVPLAAITAAGHTFKWRMPSSLLPDAEPATALRTLGQPFSTWMPLASSADGTLSAAREWWPMAIVSIWAVGSLIVIGRWTVQWIRVLRIARAGTPLSGDEADILASLTREHRQRDVRLVAVEALIEPGLFGIVRPTILWPSCLRGRLTREQITTILEHELSHLARRDNLAAALHALTETVFWFHPLTWWIGRQLVDERERACDEAVIARGYAPHLYAQSIVDTCALFVDAPPACIAGVSGADLITRVETIMTNRHVHALRASKKLLIASLLAATLATPLVAGLISPILHAQIAVGDASDPAFDVVSIKPSEAGPGSPRRLTIQPGGRVLIQNLPIRTVIGAAYGTDGMLPRFRTLGGPSWLDTKTFTIVAQAEGGLDFGPSDSARLRGMLRTMLARRFTLKAHKETRELPVYALVLARKDGRLGPALKPSTDCTSLMSARLKGAPPEPNSAAARAIESCGLNVEGDKVIGGGLALDMLASLLTRRVGRVVVDRTGLSGLFEFTMTLSSAVNEPPSDPLTASPLDDPIVAAVEDQLGLRLKSSTGMVDVVVIDSIEPPTED